MYLFKFETSVQDVAYFIMYANTLIRGTAIITSNPVVVQMLDAKGTQQTEPSEDDIQLFKETFNDPLDS